MPKPTTRRIPLHRRRLKQPLRQHLTKSMDPLKINSKELEAVSAVALILFVVLVILGSLGNGTSVFLN